MVGYPECFGHYCIKKFELPRGIFLKTLLFVGGLSRLFITYMHIHTLIRKKKKPKKLQGTITVNGVAPVTHFQIKMKIINCSGHPVGFGSHCETTFRH